MDGIWRELRTLRTATSRITSALSGSIPNIVLRKINRIASGQLQSIGPDCHALSVYAISVESLSIGTKIMSKSDQQTESISLIKKIILDHNGDVLESSPSRVVACWLLGEESKQTVIARLAVQAALKVSATIDEQIVCCVCCGNLNYAIVGGVYSQFLQVMYGEVLQTLECGNALARTQGSRLMLSNDVLSLNVDLSFIVSVAMVFDGFSSCSIPSSDTHAPASPDVSNCLVQHDITGASPQLILNCVPFFSPERQVTQSSALNLLTSAFASLCVRIKIEALSCSTDFNTDSVMTETFIFIQAVVVSLQKHCFNMNGELWRIVVNGDEARLFLGCWSDQPCDFSTIERLISCIVCELNAMNVQFSIGIDSKPATIISYGPKSRSTTFIQSESVSISESIAASCLWNHLGTGCPGVFPTTAHDSLIPAGSHFPNFFKFAVISQKDHSFTKPLIFFEFEEALSAIECFLQNISDDPHQGVLAICGCFGSGKSHSLQEMYLASEAKGIRSLRCCPEVRSSPPLAPFISILCQLLEIDLQTTPKESKLQKCREYVRSQMLSDDRDVALLGVVLGFTLENDLLEGLTVAEILEELKSVISRAFHALGSAPHPFVLFIENIHLLDSFSWDLLLDLASKKVNVVCEALDAYDADIFALEMKAFLRHGCVTRVHLSAVSLQAFEVFLCKKFKCDRVQPEVVSYIRTQSGSRNLFANEWSDYMMKNRAMSIIDNQLVFSGEYCHSVNLAVPSSLQLLIEADFFRLEETQRLFLKVVAMLGKSFTLEDVCFLSRQQSSKPFASINKTSIKEALVTYELCSRLCELGFLRQDLDSQELFTVTYVAPSILTAAGSTPSAVLKTQKAAGLACDSVVFWCFQSHIVQSIVIGQVRDDQKKAISLKIAAQCLYSSKALTSQAQELSKSSFRIAQHLFEGGNTIDALSVIHTLSPSSIYNYLRENVLFCFPPPVSYVLNEDAYVASRIFFVPWIREFCRCMESINPFKMRSSMSPRILRSAASRAPSSRSCSPSAIQVTVSNSLCVTKFYKCISGTCIQAEIGVEHSFHKVFFQPTHKTNGSTQKISSIWRY
jgi:hypothetical protein